MLNFRQLIIIFLSICYLQSYAQKTDYFIGRIKDRQSNKPITNANIVNLNTKQGTTSNVLGFFMIKGSEKDYLKITFVGYNDIYTQINANSDTLELFLSRKIFQLEEVQIIPWTKKTFKYEFVKLKPPTDTIEWLEKRINLSKEELIWLTPVSFHNYKTSKERQEIKLISIKKWEEKDKLYRNIIDNITHYKEEELQAFIIYCHFSKDYILNTREFYITEAVKKKFMEFENTKVK